MSFFDSDTWKVNGAALFGFSSSNLNVFFRDLEPTLNFLILIGQVVITFLTALYLFWKWQTLAKKRKKK